MARTVVRLSDLRIKITAQLDEGLATKELQVQLDRISKNLKVTVGIDPKQFQDVQDAIKNIQNQISKKRNIVDENDIKNGKQLFTTVDQAVEQFKKLGQVKINKIFDPATKELKSFNLEIQKADGLISKLRFDSTKSQNMHGVDGFVLTKNTELDKRSIETEKALSKTLQNRQQEERKATEAQAQAINKNLENKQKEIQSQKELNKQIQQEIEFYQRSKQIQKEDLIRRYGDNVDKKALNQQMSKVDALDPSTISSMKELKNAQKDIDLGFKQISSSVKSSSSHMLTFGEAFKTAMVKFCRLD